MAIACKALPIRSVDVSTNNVNTSLIERIQHSYKQLNSVAANLNTASDELGRSISALDEALKKLGLGITSWFKFAGEESEHGNFWLRKIGYAKIGTRWGIALNRASGNCYDPDTASEETWLFNDAPRELRLEAIGHIADMLDNLIGDAETARQRIQDRASEAQQLADAIALTVPKSVLRGK